MEKYLKNPTRPLRIEGIKNTAELVEKMGGISFQGRTLSKALSIWKGMLKEDLVIFLGLAGALIPEV